MITHSYNDTTPSIPKHRAQVRDVMQGTVLFSNLPEEIEGMKKWMNVEWMLNDEDDDDEEDDEEGVNDDVDDDDDDDGDYDDDDDDDDSWLILYHTYNFYAF